MPSLDVNGERIEYLSRGSGEPVVLLHGVGACAQLSGGVLASLARKRAAYAISLRGHGGSSCNGELSARALAQDVMAATQALKLPSFHLVGISLGAAAALHVAAMAPESVRSLAVSGIGLEPGQALADEIYGIREAVHYLAPDAFARQVADAMLAPDSPDSQREALRRSIAELTKQRYLQALEALSAARPSAVAEQVRAPVLTLRGELDELVSKTDADALAKALGGAARAEIADAGHLADIDNPAGFSDRLDSFFDSL